MQALDFMGEIIAVYAAAILGCLIGFGTLIHFTYISIFWSKAVATVVENSVGRSSTTVSNERFSYVYFAVLEFTDSTGKIHTAKGDIGKNKPWAEGKKISISYKPKNPAHILTMNLLQRLIFSGVFIAIGLVSVYLLVTKYEI